MLERKLKGEKGALASAWEADTGEPIDISTATAAEVARAASLLHARQVRQMRHCPLLALPFDKFIVILLLITKQQDASQSAALGRTELASIMWCVAKQESWRAAAYALKKLANMQVEVLSPMTAEGEGEGEAEADGEAEAEGLLIILDLDETLLFKQGCRGPNQLDLADPSPHQCDLDVNNGRYSRQRTFVPPSGPRPNYDFLPTLPRIATICTLSGYAVIRPHAITLLQYISKRAKEGALAVCIFTASEPEHADPLLDGLELAAGQVKTRVCCSAIR